MKKIDPRYYETTDFGAHMAKTAAKTYKPAGTRRVTMNLSEDAFARSSELDTGYKIGYQNVLKVAINLGLDEMEKRSRPMPRIVAKRKGLRAPKLV